MPSLPVLDPTINTGLPSPSAVALTTLFLLTIPKDIALISGFPEYTLSTTTSPPTTGTPKQFP